MPFVAELGADRIELYTETYASAWGTERQAEVLAGFAATAQAALAVGLGINAGHDLTVANLPALVAVIPRLAEVSIGHGLTADALEFGMAETVRRFRKALGW